MEYPFVTVTDAGANLLANTNGDPDNSLIIDKAIFSNQKSNTDTPLEQLTPADFANPLIYKITTVKHNQNTIQPEVNLDNQDFKQDYPVYMIGILAHAQNDTSGNETLYAVEEASDDPLIMPKATDNDFKCTFGIPIGISRSQDVNIITTGAGTVSDKDFQDYQNSMNSQLSASQANQRADSSSLTNLSQSASYNSSNIDLLSASVSANSFNIKDSQYMSTDLTELNKRSTHMVSIINDYDLDDSPSNNIYLSANSTELSSLSSNMDGISNQVQLNSAGFSNLDQTVQSNLMSMNAASYTINNIGTVSRPSASDFNNLKADSELGIIVDAGASLENHITAMNTNQSHVDTTPYDNATEAISGGGFNSIASNSASIASNSDSIMSLKGRLDKTDNNVATIGNRATNNTINLSSMGSNVSSLGSVTRPSASDFNNLRADSELGIIVDAGASLENNVTSLANKGSNNTVKDASKLTDINNLSDGTYMGVPNPSLLDWSQLPKFTIDGSSYPMGVGNSIIISQYSMGNAKIQSINDPEEGYATRLRMGQDHSWSVWNTISYQ